MFCSLFFLLFFYPFFGFFVGHIVKQLFAETFPESGFSLDESLHGTKVLTFHYIPKSSIVYPKCEEKEGVGIKELKERAIELFEKYVRVRSEYEINIPSSLRHGMAVKMGCFTPFSKEKLTERDIFEVFDKIIDEMYYIQGDSFRRFKRTPEFDEVIPLFAGTKEPKIKIDGTGGEDL